MNKAARQEIRSEHAELQVELDLGQVVHIGELPFGFDIARRPSGPPSEEYCRNMARLSITFPKD